MPWWNKSSKGKARNSLPDIFRHLSPSPSPSPGRKSRRNSSTDEFAAAAAAARRSVDLVELHRSRSPSPACGARRSVDLIFAQPLPRPQTPNSPTSNGSNGRGIPFSDLWPLPLPSPKEIVGKEEVEDVRYGIESVSSDVSMESVEGLRFSHNNNGDVACNSSGNCASHTTNIGSKVLKHDKLRLYHNFQENKLSGSQPIKISKSGKRDGTNDIIFEAKSAPATGFSSPIHSPRRLSNVEFPFLVNFEANLGHELAVSSSNPLRGCSSATEFLLQSSSDKGRVSPEWASQQSTKSRSPGQRAKIQNGAVSPKQSKFASDFSAARHDDNSFVSVHPLPLPPGRPILFGSNPLSPSSPPTGAHRSPGRSEMPPTPGQWQKGKRLGSGTFGTVYEGFNRETGDMCAMKEVPLIPDDSQSCESIKQLGQEINLLSRLKHPNIVQYYGSETLEDRLYIYLELVAGGSIYKILREYGPLKEPVIRIYTRQILSGLAYLHSTNTVHRDIKGANLLVDTSGRVKLADFGMAKHISGPSLPSSFKGSPHWMAPEIMTQSSSGHDLAVDIWSLGCTVIEMATGKPPWSEYEGAAAMFKVFKNEVPPIPDCLSSEGKDFVKCCLRRNPAERSTAFELLDHLFVREIAHHDSSDLLSSAMTAIKSPGAKERDIYSSAAMISSGIHSGNGKQHQLPSSSGHSQLGTFVPPSNAPLSSCPTFESFSLSPSQSSPTLPTASLSGNVSNRSMTYYVNEGNLNLPLSSHPRNGNTGISQMLFHSEACNNFNLYSPTFHRTEVSPLRMNCRSDDTTHKTICRPLHDLDSRQPYLMGIGPEMQSHQSPKRSSEPNLY